jgi:serine/threonine protein phosphatase PrpC
VVQVAHLVESSREGQDRVSILRVEDATILLVADGSGGMSGGAQAAERALQEISEAARHKALSDRASWLPRPNRRCRAGSGPPDGRIRTG